MSIEHQQIRHEEGDKLMLGFWWVEPFSSFRTLVYMVGGPAALAVSVPLLRSGPKETLLGLIFLVGGAVALWLWWKAPPFVGSRIRALAFATDGTVLFADRRERAGKQPDPQQLPWQTMRQTVGQVQGISLRAMPEHERQQRYGVPKPGERVFMAHEVVVDFTTGERFLAGEDLSEDQARLIQVQLLEAWNRISMERQERGLA